MCVCMCVCVCEQEFVQPKGVKMSEERLQGTVGSRWGICYQGNGTITTKLTLRVNCKDQGKENMEKQQ